MTLKKTYTTQRCLNWNKKTTWRLYYYFTFTFLLRLPYKKGKVLNENHLHLTSKPSKNKSQTQKALHNLHLIIKYFCNYTSRALTSCRFIVGSARDFKKSTIQEKPESCGPLRSTAELTVHISPQLIVPPHTSPMTYNTHTDPRARSHNPVRSSRSLFSSKCTF